MNMSLDREFLNVVATEDVECCPSNEVVVGVEWDLVCALSFIGDPAIKRVLALFDFRVDGDVNLGIYRKRKADDIKAGSWIRASAFRFPPHTFREMLQSDGGANLCLRTSKGSLRGFE